MAQELAEALGIPVDDVAPQVEDTETVGYASSTSGSGMVFKTDWAVYEAARDIKRQLIKRSAWAWQVPACLVEYDAGVVFQKHLPERRMTFKELVARMNLAGDRWSGGAMYTPRAWAALAPPLW